MDLQEFKAFAEASEATVRPFKQIIKALFGLLILTVIVFGGCFWYFMYKAFNMDAAAYLVQDVDWSINSTNNAVIRK